MKDNHPEFHTWIEPELEARIVAWVLSEASEFEAAELERIANERPEVMAFKREIEAIHGLTAAAMRLERNPLRLSPERRANLLEKLGASPAINPEKVAVMPPKSQRPWWSLRMNLVAYAAIVLLMAVLAGISLPVFSSVQTRAKKTKMTFHSMAAPNPGMRDLDTDDHLEIINGLQSNQLPGPALANRNAQPSAAAHNSADARSTLEEISKNISARAKEVGANESSSTAALSSDEIKKYLHSGIALYSSASPDQYGPADAFSNAPSGAEGPLLADSKPAPGNDADSAMDGITGEHAQQNRRALIIRGSILPTEPITAGARWASSSDALMLPSSPKLEVGAAATRLPSQTDSSERVDDLSRKPAASADSELALNGENTYSGGTVVNSGDLVLNGGKASSAGIPTLGDVPVLGSLKDETPAPAPAAQPQVQGFAEREISRGGEEKADTAKENASLTAANTPGASGQLYQVDKAWDMPVRKFGNRDSIIVTDGKSGSDGTQRISEKLNRIVIPKIEFKNATVREAIDFLRTKSKELDTTESDPSRRGVNIVLKTGQTPPAPVEGQSPGDAPDTNLGDATLNLSLSNVPLVEALNYVTKLANLKYKLDPYAAFVVPQSEATDVLITKEFNVPPDFFTETGTSSAKSPREFLEHAGLQFPPGAYAKYFPESGKLIVKTTQENLDLVDTLADIAKSKAPTKQQAQEQIAQSETAVKDQPFSTFSLHVSDVSFRLAQAALARGEMPDPESIRPEEFYNAFDYGDPAPAAGEKVGCRIEQCAHPFLQQRNLVRIAMRVPASGRGQGQPLRLTVLLDTSGSMEREDRSASVRRAMEVLASLLGPNDRVTLIGFSRQPRLLLDQIPGDQAAKLVEAVTHTPSEGGTNLEEALNLAGEQARKQLLQAAQNRIVLLTDGAVNLGNAQPESLSRMVEKLRQQGISFDACGVGADGINDEILEALTRKGNGRYYILNRPEDADTGFARQLAGAFRPAAQNVKVQVRFNPARVAHYRLIGFEQHQLKKEDFHNDKVNAAELAAEEAAVALYQVEVLPEGEGELGEVSVRFRETASSEMVERSWTLAFDAQARVFDKASPSMQLAGTAAMMAEKLRGGAMANLIDLDTLTPVVNALRNQYAPQANVQALVTMFGQMQRLK